MTDRIRKRVFLTIAVLILCAVCFLAADTLKNYTHTVPIVVGPYREALFTVSFFLLAVCLGFAYKPFSGTTICGTICLTIPVLWFTAEKLLKYKSPDSVWLERIAHGFPLPLILFGVGAALWFGEFYTKRTALKLSDGKLFLLVLLLMFIVLQPVLKGGFYWDDAFFSVEAQNMRLEGISIWERVWKEIVDYVRIGRINPFATFHFLVFYYLPDVHLYKLMLVCLTLLNGWLFYRFLRLWGRDRKFAISALLITLLCFQFRLYHDPLNSYYGLMQVMFCELMLALTAFLHWMREGKKGSLAVSLLFFMMGLMSYEMFFPLTALFLILAWAEEKHMGRAIRKTLPWIFAAVLIFGMSMLLRRNITEETAYTGTTFSLDIPLLFRTITTQVGAAFPLSYRNAGYDNGVMGTLILWHEIFNSSLSVFLRSIQWQDLLGCFLLLLILFGTEHMRTGNLCREADKSVPVPMCSAQIQNSYELEKTKFSGVVLFFGLMLWLLPGLVISLSSKYQQDLVPGLAYIPVLFSYFGMGIMLYEVFALIGKFFKPRTLRLLLGGAGCMILLLTLQDNRHISAMLDDWFLYPRKAGEEALQAGILGEHTAGTVISAVPYSLWEHGWLREPYQEKFYSLNARRPVNAVGAWDYVERFREAQTVWETPAETMLVTYGGNELGGFAKAGILNGTAFVFENHELKTPMASEVFVYVSGQNRSGVSLIYETRDAEWKQLPIEEAWLVNETAEGALYKIQERRPVMFDTVGLVRAN